MANAKRTKSGKWTCLVYSHTETTAEGKEKRIYRRFTASTKREAEQKAKEFEVNTKGQLIPAEMTVSEMVNLYIDLRSQILSPNTIRGYRVISRNSYPLIGNITLGRLNNSQIQKEINLEAARLSPKSIRNIYGLFSAALAHYAPDFRLHITYPEHRQTEIQIPSDMDIQILLGLCASSRLRLAIELAACMGLRRGEISALQIQDVDLKKRVLHVRHSIAIDDDGNQIEKAPKTKAGKRNIEIPAFVLPDMTPHMFGKTPEDPLLGMSPTAITRAFARLVKSAGIPHITFHALRHYYASVLLANNVPDKYAMERMGHATSGMLKRVYQHTMDSKEKEISECVAGYLNDVFGSNKSCI